MYESSLRPHVLLFDECECTSIFAVLVDKRKEKEKDG